MKSKAAAELLRRRKARTTLEAFTTFTFPRYVAEAAHALIGSALDAVVSGEIQRLMIFAPPQNGKSELASVRLPAYWLGRRPEDPVILSSYAASLAENKSRQARQIVEGTEFRRLFPGLTTRRDSRAVDHWELDGHKGGMLAVGVGGPITGHGARLGIIDDPVENWEQAQSQTIRDKTWEWYRTTFRTRIWENGAIVLIMTRWHEDDLAGRLLAEQGDEWTVLRLPAIAETQADRDSNNERLGLAQGRPDPLGRKPGEPLCPKRFSLAALELLRRDVGSLAWFGQYQGVPRAPEGNRFKRDWFKIVDEGPPPSAPRVRYWDRAATEGDGDFTVGLRMAKDKGVYFIEDVVGGQWSSGRRDEMMKQTAEADRKKFGNRVKIWLEQEPGSSGKDSAQAAIQMLAGYPVHAETATGSKEVRAEPFAAQAEAGNVKVVRGRWNAEYVEELTTFPNGAFDDQVDGSSGAFNKLGTAGPSFPPRDMGGGLGRGPGAPLIGRYF